MRILVYSTLKKDPYNQLLISLQQLLLLETFLCHFCDISKSQKGVSMRYLLPSLLSKFPSVKSKEHPALDQNRKDGYIQTVNNMMMKCLQLKINTKANTE